MKSLQTTPITRETGFSPLKQGFRDVTTRKEKSPLRLTALFNCNYQEDIHLPESD